jgi:hypothetical protein
MSYEGYSQFLCKKGHAWAEDCNFSSEFSKCPICGEKHVWENMVDETNGTYDDEGKRIDGYVDLKEKERKTCKHCKTTLEVIYKIPKTKRKK